MNAPLEAVNFFAPVCMDMIDRLIAEYDATKANMQRLASTMNEPPYKDLIHYYLEAASSDAYKISLRHVDRLFDNEKAIKVLNSDFWNRALRLTDVLDCMPEKRREEWFSLMRNHDTPDFEEQTVRATLMDLLSGRARFFAERVDGIFQALSREHVTNCPEGFSKRMILYYTFSAYGSSDRAGYINDLRAVIAKLTGRDEPKWYATKRLLDIIKKESGKWFDVDGGALRIRVYKKGTAHLEVHPDMAVKLNQILAYLHPAAIPSEFRTPQKKKPKDIRIMQRPLPFAVIEILSEVTRKGTDGYVYRLPFGSTITAGARDLAIQALQGLGGTMLPCGSEIQFDHCVEDVLSEVVISGCVPDEKSHQFYPTPEPLARRVVALAEIEQMHICLEPQAGHGGLAMHLPKDRTTCIEINPLNCKILVSKGLNAIERDFLLWEEGANSFDRIVMNPPFNLGRWKEHLNAAWSKLKPGGRLVSILPSGAKTNTELRGGHCLWHGPFDNEFPGTSVSVVILVADKALT